jgi:hypothetical protein
MATKHPVNTPVDVTITPDTSQYADGDVIGGLLTFSFAAKAGMLVTLIVTENDNEGAVLDLFLFSSEPSTIADNATFAPTFADTQKLLRKIPIAAGDYFTENSIKVAQIDLQSTGSPLPFSSVTLYGYLVTNGSTPTFAGSKTIQLRLIPLGDS